MTAMSCLENIKRQKNKIVSKYLYLSDILAKKFLNRGIDYEDIYQVASIA